MVSAPSPGLLSARVSVEKTLCTLGNACQAATQFQLSQGGQNLPPSLVLTYIPLCVYRSTSTVGFPRESRISRAWILSTAMVSLGRGKEKAGPAHAQF